jgi:cytochrome c oxidase subunit 4
MSTAHAHTHDEHSHDHGGLKTYATILAALLVLTVITVGASYFDFGAANIVIAVMIATVKASLVALFFMHLKYDKPVNGMILVSCFLFLGLLLVFCLLDIDNRVAEAPTGKAMFKPQGPPSLGHQQTSTDKVPPPPAKGAAAPAGHGGAEAHH